MKILRVITRMNVGGPARQVRSLHFAMRALGHETTLVYGRLDEGEGDAAEGLSTDAGIIKIKKLCRPIRPFDDMCAFLSLLNMLLREPYEILHTHTAKAGLLARSAAILAKPWRDLKKFPKLKVIHTYHGHVFSGYFSKKMSALICRIERYLWNHSDILITLTPKLQGEIIGHLGTPEHKMKIVPLGLNLAPYLEVQRKAIFQNDLPSKKVIVGWVGRFVGIKNPVRFIDMAQSILSLVGDEVGFVMVGDGALRAMIEETLSSRGLGAHFFLTGWRMDLENIYAGFDVLINTSDNEGTPVAVLEALSSGLCVAATDVGGTSEILNLPDQPVICFAPQEAKVVCSRIATWLNENRRIDEDIRKKIVSEYSEENLVLQLLEIYEELLVS